MKLILALILSFGVAVCAYAGGEVKEVCTPKVDKAGKAVMDKKTGKQAQDCKKIKTHKKVEGDKVPEPAKKK
jgi:hypothetical protein